MGTKTGRRDSQNDVVTDVLCVCARAVVMRFMGDSPLKGLTEQEVVSTFLKVNKGSFPLRLALCLWGLLHASVCTSVCPHHSS